MARKKSRYVCGKCGERCGSAKELREHVGKHKARPRGGRGRTPGFKGICRKCGVEKRFKNRSSFAQHQRFCKGSVVETTFVKPIPPGRQPFSGPSLLQTMLKQGVENGSGVAERLKAEAAALRKRSDEILEYVKSFEAGAAKFLTK